MFEVSRVENGVIDGSLLGKDAVKSMVIGEVVVYFPGGHPGEHVSTTQKASPVGRFATDGVLLTASVFLAPSSARALF